MKKEIVGGIQVVAVLLAVALAVAGFLALVRPVPPSSPPEVQDIDTACLITEDLCVDSGTSE